MPGRAAEFWSAAWLPYNRILLKIGLIFRSEGVLIFPVERGGASSLIQLSQNLRRSIRRALQCLTLLCCLLTLSAWAQQQVVTQIRVIGNRQIPKETILARMFSHVNEPTIHSRWSAISTHSGTPATSRTCASRRKTSPKGVILDVYVTEKPTIREINYKGLNSVTQSDVLDRFKKEKVGLSIESKYDPTRIAHAIAVLKECSPSTATSSPPSRPTVKNDSACLRPGELHHQGRPQGQGRQDSVHRQRARHLARAARVDEEPAPHRHSHTPSSSRTSSPAPTTPASLRKTPSASVRPIATADIFAAPASATRRPTCATKPASPSSPSARAKASASTSPCPSRRASATASAPSLSPATRPSRT